ncbi:hypothetical protein BPAE_0032g00760 [Botrytis paeoniae]|uniref:Protein kinase domain-containing protein n=1 Tax=Botrytis paeoniae TaxID=278948 RepID=A0A4Z1G1K9_9HELO|nr:hypothetical protein BPAE_0032g00760 [Botrytis paeoniae]
MAENLPPNFVFEEIEDNAPFVPDPDPENKIISRTIRRVVPIKALVTRFPGKYAIKSIALEYSEEEDGINSGIKRMFIQEAKNLHFAHHVHVIELSMAFSFSDVEEKYLAIAMPLADIDMERYLRSALRNEKKQLQISEWFGCIAKAVEWIHGIGIRHRDIKPSNILLKSGKPLLADFGISKMGIMKTLSTTVPGLIRDQTRKYVAPEVGDGGTRGRAADIFSLGVVFLEMLVYHCLKLYPKGYSELAATAAATPSQRSVGLRPEPAYINRLENVHEWMQKFANTMTEEHWHRKMLNLCRKMMNKDREDRPSAGEVYSIVSSFSQNKHQYQPGPCSCVEDTDLTEGQKIVEACKQNDGLALVQDFLQRDEKKYKNTPGAIHQASAHGLYKTVEIFLKYGADIDLVDYSNQTALHCASGGGQHALVDLLLRNNANVLLKDYEEQTPLHCASGYGDLTTFERLIKVEELKAQVAAQDIYGQTALHNAARRGHTEIVRILLQHMDLTAVLSSNNRKQTALHLAAGCGSVEVINLLLGFSRTTATAAEAVNKQDERGWAPLCFASSGTQLRGDYEEVIRILRYHGADVNLQDKQGYDAIHYAKHKKERVLALEKAVENSEGTLGMHSVSVTMRGSNLGNELSRIIQPHRQYTNSDIQHVSEKLRDQHPGWEFMTRIYVVLHIIDIPEKDILELMEQLQKRGITDHRLPFSGNDIDLANILKPSLQARFNKEQQKVLSHEFQFDEKLGEHYNLSTNKWGYNLEKMETLGTGNSGKVHKVKSMNTGRIFALKLIRRSSSDNEGRAEEELNTLKRVKHANIVSLVGSFTSPKYFGIIMEPAAQYNLNSFLLDASTDLEKRALLPTFFGCLIDALWYLHNVAFVRHNDIKPQNILVQGRCVYLTDFGISLDWSESLLTTTWGPAAMTPMYCAPEAFRGDGSRDTYSDIWGLGCIFLEIMTVLKGRKVKDIVAFFIESNSSSIEYHRNILPVSRWINILEENIDFVNRPFQWIKEMLNVESKSRPTARSLQQRIAKYQHASKIKLSGACCREKFSNLNELVAAGTLEDGFEIPLEEHSRVSAIGLPGEQIRAYFLNKENYIQERIWDASLKWVDGTLNELKIKAAPFSQLAVASWENENIVLYYQTEDRNINVLHGWVSNRLWKRGAKVTKAAHGSVLSVVGFNHYGSQSLRLYYEDDDSILREACWERFRDADRTEEGAFGWTLGHFGKEKPPGAFMSAIVLQDEGNIEIPVYLSTVDGIKQYRYAWPSVWDIETDEELEASVGPISAFRWGDKQIIITVAGGKLIDIEHHGDDWSRSNIHCRMACSGQLCPGRQEI